MCLEKMEKFEKKFLKKFEKVFDKIFEMVFEFFFGPGSHMQRLEKNLKKIKSKFVQKNLKKSFDFFCF